MQLPAVGQYSITVDCQKLAIAVAVEAHMQGIHVHARDAQFVQLVGLAMEQANHSSSKHTPIGAVCMHMCAGLSS